ncbi:pesticidal protein Cry1Ba [Acinetobacter sp. COS3]|uniref:Na+/H+ antiporter subunit E n=1 Tax=Acinetobacter TaxID=469 RepID=UPI0003B8872C|nr:MULTISPECIES: Na+/H+ antiporter subunit E [Acinetobacter]MDA0696423.1 Na+/H+ antiporter subunit E [Pseudomonadota bacterium]ERS02159.1 pesticidal protein Cry1Ba [Acinetobacter sp. COS3]KXO86723.1 pesticidal protein Cry1Ba [Acinetobacter venetianus]MBC70278.1 Na+/H+ antiporter subunit E [Acinetobacter sp.]MBT49430.1 Na+/H+ antiporter subunit E [Acinetobacter sp.]|tara:strand:- start:549 stop:1076 length:528 start_codon:yes stop_codon:yes gene_type:complete
MQKVALLDRWFPHPFVSFLVFLSWLMLSHSLDLTDILVAILLAIIIPRLVGPFISRTPHIHWTPAVKLFFVVLWDIIVSNFRVAKMVLGPMDQLHPRWYRVPLETEHEEVNTLLAMIITTTPGTVSAGIDQERGDILVHALSSDDTELDIQEIKKRYETPLLEIFDVKIEEGASK